MVGWRVGWRSARGRDVSAMRSAMWVQWVQIERGQLVQRCTIMYLDCTERERLVQVRPANRLVPAYSHGDRERVREIANEFRNWYDDVSLAGDLSMQSGSIAGPDYEQVMKCAA